MLTFGRQESLLPVISEHQIIRNRRAVWGGRNDGMEGTVSAT